MHNSHRTISHKTSYECHSCQNYIAFKTSLCYICVTELNIRRSAPATGNRVQIPGESVTVNGKQRPDSHLLPSRQMKPEAAAIRKPDYLS